MIAQYKIINYQQVLPACDGLHHRSDELYKTQLPLFRQDIELHVNAAIK
jgi:hypothetical protein